MLRSFLTSAVLLTLLAGSALAKDEVILFSDSDPEMNAAIEKARATLPEFWSHVASPAAGESGFSVKLALTDGDAVEHFWCSDIVGSAAQATCVIANEPAYVMTVKFGERVDIHPVQISDWMYWVGDKIRGGETQRVMIGRMPEEMAAEYRAMLLEE